MPDPEEGITNSPIRSVHWRQSVRRVSAESANLLGDGDPTCGPFTAAAGLGLAGFFFPLLKPVLGMGGQPAIRQQSFQGGGVARWNGRNPP